MRPGLQVSNIVSLTLRVSAISLICAIMLLARMSTTQAKSPTLTASLVTVEASSAAGEVFWPSVSSRPTMMQLLPPTLTSISPTEAYNHQATTIALTGTDFVATPTVLLGNVVLGNLTFLDSTMLTATVPADLPGGTYTVTVTSPDGQSSSLASAFTVYRRGDGLLGLWQITSSMVEKRSSAAAVVAGDYIYVLGGEDYSGPVRWSSVEYAKINSDGSLGPWQATSSMSTERAELSAIAAREYIYALGGCSFEGCHASVERAKINSDGSLGPWQATSSMSKTRARFSAVRVGDYIYAIGGDDSVEFARINFDGSLSQWQTTNTMTTLRLKHAAVAVGRYLYVLGGFDGNSRALDSVEQATVNADGFLGPWQVVSSMSQTRPKLAAATSGGYIYVLGREGEIGSRRSVARTTVNTDGSLSPWQVVASMNLDRMNPAAVTTGGRIYAIGGNGGGSGLETWSNVEQAAISPPSLIDLSPSAASANHPTTITISGSNFLPLPSVRLGDDTTLAASFVSPSTLTATVPWKP